MKHTGKGLYGLLIIAVLSLAILAGCGGGGGGGSSSDNSGGTSDTTAPSNTTASNFINSGASSTSSATVTLAISATDSVGVTGYYASETSTAPSATASGWTAITSTTSYSADASFTLSSGDGTKTVYVWFKDAAGNVSAVASDTITLSTPTANDFVGTWKGSYSNTIVYTGTTTVAETGSGNLTLVLALSNGSLAGTLTDSNANGWTTGTTITLSGITVTNGTLSFPVQNTQSSDPDCANWDVTSTATLDSSMANMNFGMSGTVCSDLAGGVHKSIGTFSSTLTKQTTSFPIATTSTGEFSLSAAFDGTNYLVVTEKFYAANTDTQTQAAQFISQSGSPVGSLISSGGTGGTPLVAFDGTNYLMIWADDNSTSNYGTCCSLNGTFITTSGVKGNNFLIAPLSSTGYKIDTYAVGSGGGAYLIAYTYATSNNNNGPHVVYGRTVSPSGTVSSEFTISTEYGDLRHGDENIAFDGTNFFVIWNEDGSDYEIRGRFVSPGGVPGTEFSINASTYYSDNPMAVAFDGTNYLVVWPDEVGGYGSGEWDLFGQLVDKSGNLVGSVVNISTATGGQYFPHLAFDGTNYLSTWTDMRNDANKDAVCDSGEGTCIDIYGQYISKSGTLVNSEFVISNDAGNQWGWVAGFNNGKYLVLEDSGSGGFCHSSTSGQVSSDCDVYGVFVTP